MPWDISNVEKFLDTEETVAAASTHSDGVEFTSNIIDFRTKRVGVMYCYVKGGNESASGNITITLKHSPDQVNWFDMDSVVITLSGSSQITDNTASLPVFPDCYPFVKLGSIQNSDASYTADVNLALYVKE